ERRLRRSHGVPEARLSCPILRPRPGTQERGKCDGNQDADDQNHHHQLDEGESPVLIVHLTSDLLDHVDVTPFPPIDESRFLAYVLCRFGGGDAPLELRGIRFPEVQKDYTSHATIGRLTRRMGMGERTQRAALRGRPLIQCGCRSYQLVWLQAAAVAG